MAEVKSRIIENFGFYHFTKKKTLLIAAHNILRPSKGPFKELLNSMQQNLMFSLHYFTVIKTRTSTNNETEGPQSVWSEIWVCYAACGVPWSH